MEDRELEALIARYEALVWTVVSGILTSDSDREEAAADVFVTLWRDNRFDPDAPGAKTYIIKVARRRAIDRLRRIPKQAEELTDESDSADVFEDTARRENARILAEVIRSLPSPAGEIFTRFYYYAQQPSVIARALGMKSGEVRRMLNDTRSAVKERLLARGVIL
ncbi:MAG: sigma-70 family RNA polymerase sigma factor [Ruminococcaceae bacterium]|nr:sigma-70 family RNA polymerase sigma factor [Oscillospiraceae bacterium]